MLSEKSPSFGPDKAMLVMESEAVPLFCKVTVSDWAGMPTGWLPNDRAVVERLTEGAGPVPVRLTVCGLPEALSVRDNTPFLEPAPLGVNATIIRQLLPGGRLVNPEHPLVLTEKSEPLGPVILAAMAPVRDALPVFVTLTVPRDVLERV
jgi:hypothetical protein